MQQLFVKPSLPEISQKTEEKQYAMAPPMKVRTLVYGAIFFFFFGAFASISREADASPTTTPAGVEAPKAPTGK